MCTPTTGSPTITLFQLRSNCHTLLNSQIVQVLTLHAALTKLRLNDLHYYPSSKRIVVLVPSHNSLYPKKSDKCPADTTLRA